MDRPASLKSSAELTKQIGGLSGAPLFEKSTQVLAKIYKETNGGISIEFYSCLKFFFYEKRSL